MLSVFVLLLAVKVIDSVGGAPTVTVTWSLVCEPTLLVQTSRYVLVLVAVMTCPGNDKFVAVELLQLPSAWQITEFCEVQVKFTFVL